MIQIVIAAGRAVTEIAMSADQRTAWMPAPGLVRHHRAMPAVVETALAVIVTVVGATLTQDSHQMQLPIQAEDSVRTTTAEMEC